MNYQKKLEEIINLIPKGKYPKLLLHACCAPCSSYCIEYLSHFFDITIYYYNPNIDSDEEFNKRANEIEKFIKEFKTRRKVNYVIENYNSSDYINAVKGFEKEKEGGKRCNICFRLRLEKAAKYASKNGFDYFTTTLSISPYKNSELLNEIGQDLESKYNIKYLYSDFKKNDGYKRSIELSHEYHLYRQDYCGCIYSKMERDNRKTMEENK